MPDSQLGCQRSLDGRKEREELPDVVEFFQAPAQIQHALLCPTIESPFRRAMEFRGDLFVGHGILIVTARELILGRELCAVLERYGNAVGNARG